MRSKMPKTVITFAATSDAMAMEVAAREHGIPGRVIPVPSEIDAGCGMAWCAAGDERDELIALMEQFGLPYEGVFEVSLY